MKQLFYATRNKSKIENMEYRLRDLDIKLITPYDLDIYLDINENGKTVIENALIKAKEYFKKTNIPTIAGDSALFVEKFNKQPGLFVKRVNGKQLDDDKLEKYYIQELEKVGGQSKAFYITGLVIIKNNEEYVKEIKEKGFIFKADRYKGEKSNDPLARLEYDEDINKYFCEMNESDKKQRNVYFDRQCVEFILNNI